MENEVVFIWFEYKEPEEKVLEDERSEESVTAVREAEVA